jgi:hypothetical protein
MGISRRDIDALLKIQAPQRALLFQDFSFIVSLLKSHGHDFGNPQSVLISHIEMGLNEYCHNPKRKKRLRDDAEVPLDFVGKLRSLFTSDPEYFVDLYDKDTRAEDAVTYVFRTHFYPRPSAPPLDSLAAGFRASVCVTNIAPLKPVRPWSPRTSCKPAVVPHRPSVIEPAIIGALDAIYTRPDPQIPAWKGSLLHMNAFFKQSSWSVLPSSDERLMSAYVTSHNSVEIEPNMNEAVLNQAAAAVMTALTTVLSAENPQDCSVSVKGSTQFQALFYQLWQSAVVDLEHEVTLPPVTNSTCALPAAVQKYPCDNAAQYEILKYTLEKMLDTKALRFHQRYLSWQQWSAAIAFSRSGPCVLSL